MTEDAFPTAFESSELFRPLDRREIRLLQVVWSSLSVSRPGFPTTWPYWDWVSRQLVSNDETYPDPNEILLQLPAIPRRTTGQHYGLIWRDMPSGQYPDITERVGLTIAGLLRLSETVPITSKIADDFVGLIASIAAAEETLESAPFQIAEDNRPLRDLGKEYQRLQTPSSNRPRMSDEVIGFVLQWELAPVVIGKDGTSMTANLRGLRTRPYRNITNATDYLSTAIRLSPEATQNYRVSPLTLTQTMDYLSYVLSAHPAWPNSRRLVHVPDLQSALTLGQPVGSQEELENRLAALWNIVSRLQVPDIPAKKLRPGQSQSSLNGLHYWLEENLPDAAPGRIESAIGALRAVGTIRQANAHSSVDTRRRAAEANARFGLPEYLSDWSAAWLSIQSHLSITLDALRQEVQLATP